MPERRPRIPKLFISQFTVDYEAPFKRHLNRLEVEIGREDYRHLKRVELVEEHPSDTQFAAMDEITGRLLKTTQNNYNRELLQRLGIRVYLDGAHYSIYYRLPDRVLRFVASWREHTLTRFFGKVPTSETGWHPCLSPADFEARFLPDHAGGVLLLRRMGERDPVLPLLTASHGPYDPHTLDVALFFLRAGKADAAMINLGFSGREPLTDENLEKLKGWGVPLNPSNIDVIYPYVNAKGHPLCYKLEEGFGRYARILGGPAPELVIDIHGCVGTRSDDYRLIVGLGGLPPYPAPTELGTVQDSGGVILLHPKLLLRRGLATLRDLSEEIYVQFCSAPHQGYQFALLGGLQMLGRTFDPHREVKSLLEGEERTYLPAEDLRWLPGAGANAHQRIEADKLNPRVQCLHVEIPTAVRRRIALKMRELAITDSLDASVL
jgi:hypothetical protein